MSYEGKKYWLDYDLANQIKMPAIGLGIHSLDGEAITMQAINMALSSGCRLFDTTTALGSESILKKGFNTYLPKYGLSREDIFLTFRLGPGEIRCKKQVNDILQRTFNKMGFDYLDLLLIQFPGPPINTPLRQLKLCSAAWDGLIEFYDEGKVNAIGVSNFTTTQLRAFMHNKHSPMPMVNQVEWHPQLFDKELVSFCHHNGIVVQGVSPYGAVDSKSSLLCNQVVVDVSDSVGVSPEQVLLAWSLQDDIAVITKNQNPARIKDNFNIDFKLTPSQIKTLTGLKINVNK